MLSFCSALIVSPPLFFSAICFPPPPLHQSNTLPSPLFETDRSVPRVPAPPHRYQRCPVPFSDPFLISNHLFPYPPFPLSYFRDSAPLPYSITSDVHGFLPQMLCGGGPVTKPPPPSLLTHFRCDYRVPFSDSFSYNFR